MKKQCGKERNELNNKKNSGVILSRGSERGRCLCEAARDVILPDLYGDIKKILRATASLGPMNIGVERSRVAYDGALVCTVLFIDETNIPRSFDVRLDLSGSTPTDDGIDERNVAYTASVESVSVKAVNPRKLGVRVTVGVDMKLWNSVDVEPTMPDCFDAESIGSVERRSQECVYSCLCDLSERDLHIRREMSVPKHLPSIGEIVSFDVAPEPMSVHVENGNVECSCVLDAELLYTADDGSVNIISEKLPINSTIEADGIEQGAPAIGHCLVSERECTTVEDMTGQRRSVSIDVKYALSATVARSFSTDYTTDIYSTDFYTESDRQRVKYSSSATAEQLSVTRRISSVVEKGTDACIMSVSGSCTLASTSDREDGRYGYVSSTITVLLKGSDGGLFSIGIPDSFEVKLPMHDEQLGNLSFKLVSDDVREDSIDLSYEVELSLICLDNNNVEIVSALRAGESDRIVQGRPLTVYFPSAGETLWQVAKRYSIAAEVLESANHGRDVGEALIIPRRRALVRS